MQTPFYRTADAKNPRGKKRKEVKKTMTNFEELGLSSNILKALKENEWITPTPIQEQAIPIAKKGLDIIGQAKTGTGKTIAFAIPLLENLYQEQLTPQALVLVPTRELALQVTEEIQRVGKYTEAQVVPVYGGEDIERQIRLIRKGAQIIVGTPGRIIDHIQRKTIDLTHIRAVVLDEADRMLDMGFIDDVKYILSVTPKERQTMLFSATMEGAILEIAQNDMRTPTEIRVSQDSLTVDQITQYYASIDPHEKYSALATILKNSRQKNQGLRAIVFCKTKFGAERAKNFLASNGFRSLSLHGNLSQAMRNQVMSAFHAGQIEVLVATDLAARGLDVDDITLIVNYDLPTDKMNYVHRIGRTGRAGKTGEAVTLVSNVAEIKELRSIARMANAEINQMPLAIEQFKTMPSNRREHRDYRYGGRPGHQGRESYRGENRGQSGGGPRGRFDRRSGGHQQYGAPRQHNDYSRSGQSHGSYGGERSYGSQQGYASGQRSSDNYSRPQHSQQYEHRDRPRQAEGQNYENRPRHEHGERPNYKSQDHPQYGERSENRGQSRGGFHGKRVPQTYFPAPARNEYRGSSDRESGRPYGNRPRKRYNY